MSELVANCPRCHANDITFDLEADQYIGIEYRWQLWYEAFCICRRCHRSTVFILSLKNIQHKEHVQGKRLRSLEDSVNDYLKVESYVNLKDMGTIIPPSFLPANIEDAFKEGATCIAVECFNAAATMFRLCIDLATRPLLPENDENGLNRNIRRSLGLRLPWLFDNGRLPHELRELSACVKEDGNDGAHAGNLQKEDAEDLLEFTFAFLERFYSEPEKLRLAKARRDDRRTPK